ncbi:Glycerol-3-phosphate acyltransferase 3-like [Bagarius yarrelli]|uniref:Glycerol-3-phosphate acyltransferase 3-like n=1 Tax=Bagarius yarrelli TaxID=175774 RepID=A0A556VWR7_BAGYA|nr:Glycerol-3-phosphate acyltransferase 3-like [Bagarius yarrelli]
MGELRRSRPRSGVGGAFALSDVFYFSKKGIESIVDDEVTQRIMLACIGLSWLVIGTTMVGFLPNCRLKDWLSELVHIMCYRICARGLSATIHYHNRENKPKKGGICVANHTSPIDVVILANDGGYAMVGQVHGGLMGVVQRAMVRASVMSLVYLTPGEDLVMVLPIPGSVEVIYKARHSTDVYGVQICTVTQRSLHCTAEYTPRTSFSYPNITLRHTKLSDSGIYSIKDTENEELLHIYTLEICNVTEQSIQCKVEYQHRAFLSRGTLVLEKVKPSDSGVYTIWDPKYNTIILIHTLSVKDYLPNHVKRHQSTTLECTWNCSSSSVEWTVNRENVVAQCNQTSCISEEGYEMSHDQYLKGHYNLTIIRADYSMRGTYFCMCNNKCISEVKLIVETENSSVQLRPGEDLLMDFPITESVEVTYSGSVIYFCDPTDQKHCKSQQRHRIKPVLKLEKVKPNDSGVYVIQDHHTKYQLLQFNVSVREDNTNGSNTWRIVSAVEAAVILGLIIYFDLMEMQKSDTSD